MDKWKKSFMVLNVVKGRQADCQTKWQSSVLARVRIYTILGSEVRHEWVKRGPAEYSVKEKVLSLVLKLLCFLIGLALLKMPNHSIRKSQGCSCRNNCKLVGPMTYSYSCVSLFAFASIFFPRTPNAMRVTTFNNPLTLIHQDNV